jgi:hypothetical protein
VKDGVLHATISRCNAFFLQKSILKFLVFPLRWYFVFSFKRCRKSREKGNTDKTFIHRTKNFTLMQSKHHKKVVFHDLKTENGNFAVAKR